MTGSAWAFIALGGIALVFAGNLLRYRRTGDAGCLGHFFMASHEMAIPEQILNRTGIAVCVVGIVASLLL